MKIKLVCLGAYLGLALGLWGCKKQEHPTGEHPTGKAAPAVDPAVAATVSGQVKFAGAAPARRKIQMTADAYCAAFHKTAVQEETVVVNPNKTLRYVLVYVKGGLEGKSFPAPSDPVTLDQKGCWYEPHVLGVQTGQPILILNSDDTSHNIHVTPKNNPGFNFSQPRKGLKATRSFSNPEVAIPVKCDVHPWMGGYIAVVPHPYFAVTAADGSFRLSGLPPGDYEIAAWHEKFGEKTAKVTLGPKESKTLTFTFGG